MNVIKRPTSADTYRITHALRGFSRSFPIRTTEAGVRMQVQRHDPESYMKWALVVGNGKFSSTLVMFDPRRMEAWVRPIERDEHYPIVGYLTKELHRMWDGFVINELARQGYRFIGGSAVLATTMTGAETLGIHK